MPINPLTFSTPQAFSGGADFSQLAKLGDIYREGQDRSAQQSALAQLGNDPAMNAQVLIKSGIPSLAQLGMRMQTEAATRAEGVREFDAQQAIRAAAEKRAQTTFNEDSPEARRAKLAKNNQNPDAPEWQTWVATGSGAPTNQQLEELKIRKAAETRAQTEFEQSQKLATPDLREAFAKSRNFKLDDPAVRAWIVTGQDFPKTQTRVGIGPPSYTVDDKGVTHEFRQSSDGTPVETVYPEGQRPMTPAELAEAKRGVTAADRKAIRDAEDQVEAARTSVASLQRMKSLSSDAWHLGPATGAVGYATSFLPEGVGGTSGAATEELRNEALQQMMTKVKAAFGGQPSNREDAWLLEAQASPSKSLRVQQDVIDRGIELMNDRVKYNRDKANELRSGTYYSKDRKEADTPEAPKAALAAKPALADFMTKARAANPGVPDSELARYWKQKYGG